MGSHARTFLAPRYRAVFLSALCIAGLIGPVAGGQPVEGKVALVIASDPYAAPADAPGCSAVGRDVAGALEGVGYEVVTVVDGTSIAIRGAIQKFTEQLAGEKKLAFAYICGRAVTAEERVFLLPSDIDPAASYRLETQGVVVTAILNAMDGAESALLVGDLNGVDAAGVGRGLRPRAEAASVQMILSARQDRDETLGRSFLVQLSQSGSERLSTAAVSQGLRRAGETATIFAISPDQLQDVTRANERGGLDIAVVPVPQARPLTVSVADEAQNANPRKISGRKKVRAPRVKQRAKPKAGFFGFFNTSPRDQQ